MKSRIVLNSVTVLYIIVLLFFFNMFIKEPVTPVNIAIPISENNRGVNVEFYAYKIPHKELLNQTFATLPENALCKAHSQSTSLHASPAFSFECIWNDDLSIFEYSIAKVTIIAPLENGVDYWEYNPEALVLRPIMNHWFFYNLEKLMLAFLLILIGLISYNVAYSTIESNKRKVARA